MKRFFQWLSHAVNLSSNCFLVPSKSQKYEHVSIPNRKDGRHTDAVFTLLKSLIFLSRWYVFVLCQPNIPVIRPRYRPTSLPLPTATLSPAINGSNTGKPYDIKNKTMTPSSSPSDTPIAFPPPSSSSSGPTNRKSNEPTGSNPQALLPTIELSDFPTIRTSDTPSFLPTFSNESISLSRFRQAFIVPPYARFFNETLFVSVLEGYTEDFASVPPDSISEIETLCIVNLQSVLNQSDTVRNEVDYTCTYTSRRVIVSNFTDYLITLINENLTAFEIDLRNVGLEVLEANKVFQRQIQSPQPSAFTDRSESPSFDPTTSFEPSLAPSILPSLVPVLPIPSLSPTMSDLTWAPSLSPVGQAKSRMLPLWAVASIVVLGGGGALIMILWYYVTWRRKQRLIVLSASPPLSSGPVQAPNLGSAGGTWDSQERGPEDARHITLSPTESLRSNKSLISAGSSGLGDDSEDEYDGTKDLQDEFDKYKDQNLEQFRDGVEGKVGGLESIMSAAVTMAHMVDDPSNLDEAELRWHCEPNCKGIDIEASALFEVSDWLKRNETAPFDRKRAFMEDILNKMVASVKNGVLNADDGSRTIHESAAILGLNMAEALPMTTLVISGMRKTATAEDMAKALREFGDIDVAAVASGLRGFGIVRFRGNKSVERAMRRYNTGEIVIQDVAIQLKILRAHGILDSRAPPEMLLHS